MTQQERCLWLIRELLREMPSYRDTPVPALPQRRWQLLRSLMNVRPPMPVTEEFCQVQDAFLQQMTQEKGVVDAKTLPPCPGDQRLALWQGDITTLKCDAIVNAANSQMLGCFSPCHGCIDNCIHTWAGVQLRLKCNDIIQKQGHEEPTGQAKITPAYNLPSKYVLHTVGPIVEGRLTQRHCDLLASCYRSCLELAEENSLHSVAFCCISTGVFMFPKEKAAEIAVETVKEYLDTHTGVEKVIFNVFQDADRCIYETILSQNL